MLSFVEGGVTLVVLAALLALTTYAGTRLGALLFGVRPFHWFDAQPAPAPLWRRFGARLVGRLAPFVVCAGLVTLVYAFSGESVPTTSVRVIGAPAREAGLEDGDRIFAVDGRPVSTWDELRDAIRSRPGKKALGVERAGVQSTLVATTSSNGTIGIEPIARAVPVGLGRALSYGVRQPVSIALAYVAAGLAPRREIELSGPVAILRTTGAAASRSLFWMPAQLASAYWPIIGGVHLFDALTLALFRLTRRNAAPLGEQAARIARRRQSLMIALGCGLVSLSLRALGRFATAGPVTMPPIFLSQAGSFALYPLVWLLASELGMRRRAWALVAVSIVPPVWLGVGSWLVVKAGRARPG
jgi:hypothetical protein